MRVFPGDSVGKQSACHAGALWATGSIAGSGRSPGVGHGNPFQYSCLENPTDRGAWQATNQGIAKSWTQLKQLNMSATPNERFSENMISRQQQRPWAGPSLCLLSIQERCPRGPGDLAEVPESSPWWELCKVRRVDMRARSPCVNGWRSWFSHLASFFLAPRRCELETWDGKEDACLVCPHDKSLISNGRGWERLCLSSRNQCDA